MRLQRIGIAGYAGVLPVAFFLLARYFWAERRPNGPGPGEQP
jgi:hypothetical protein